jgi:ATP-dependent protease ClpP protease subunit
MHQLHCIAPTADLLASLRPKQMGVQCAVTDDAVEIFLHGIIGDEYTETDSLSVGRILAANRGKPVTLRVNSPGGLAYDGVAMYNAIDAHDGKTTGIIEGLAGSAASLAVVACDVVKCHSSAAFHPHYSLVDGVRASGGNTGRTRCSGATRQRSGSGVFRSIRANNRAGQG